MSRKLRKIPQPFRIRHWKSHSLHRLLVCPENITSLFHTGDDNKNPTVFREICKVPKQSCLQFPVGNPQLPFVVISLWLLVSTATTTTTTTAYWRHSRARWMMQFGEISTRTGSIIYCLLSFDDNSSHWYRWLMRFRKLRQPAIHSSRHHDNQSTFAVGEKVRSLTTNKRYGSSREITARHQIVWMQCSYLILMRHTTVFITIARHGADEIPIGCVRRGMIHGF